MPRPWMRAVCLIHTRRQSASSTHEGRLLNLHTRAVCLIHTRGLSGSSVPTGRPGGFGGPALRQEESSGGTEIPLRSVWIECPHSVVDSRKHLRFGRGVIRVCGHFLCSRRHVLFQKTRRALVCGGSSGVQFRAHLVLSPGMSHAFGAGKKGPVGVQFFLSVSGDSRMYGVCER